MAAENIQHVANNIQHGSCVVGLLLLPSEVLLALPSAHRAVDVQTPAARASLGGCRPLSELELLGLWEAPWAI